jgi:hypothetical protein
MSVYTDVPRGMIDLYRVARRIKTRFIAAKTKQIGKAYNMQSRFSSNDELWENAARICIHRAVSPVDFVEAIFQFNKVPGGPFPLQVGSKFADSAVVRYKNSKSDGMSFWEEKLTHARTYMNQVETNTNGRITAFDVLTKHPYCRNIDPVIACCILGASKKVLEVHGREAKEQVTSDPALLEYLRKLHLRTNWIHAVK